MRQQRHHLILVALFVIIALAVGASDSDSVFLDHLVGKDLWEEPQAELSRLADITGEIPKGEISPPQPWHVWRRDAAVESSFILLLGERALTVPGGSSACIQLLNRNAARLGTWCFQTGHRLDLAEASFAFSRDIGSELIVLRMNRQVNGRNVAREYFSLRDRPLLVRLEDDKGRSVQNEYVFPNYEIGLPPAATTVREFSEMLASSDKAMVLSALMFLGGRHLCEPERTFTSEPQESRYAALFQELLANEKVLEVISKLSRSNDRWIRDAAVLASRGLRERRLD